MESRTTIHQRFETPQIHGMQCTARREPEPPRHHLRSTRPQSTRAQRPEHEARSNRYFPFFFLCLSFYFVLNECCSASFWLMPLKAFQPFDRIILKSVCDFSTALVLFFFFLFLLNNCFSAFIWLNYWEIVWLLCCFSAFIWSNLLKNFVTLYRVLSVSWVNGQMLCLLCCA